MAVSEGKNIFLVPQVLPLFFTVGLGLSISLLPEISKVKDNFLLGAIAPTVKVAQAQQPADTKVIRIGYQKYGTLSILKAKATLEASLKAQGISV